MFWTKSIFPGLIKTRKKVMDLNFIASYLLKTFNKVFMKIKVIFLESFFSNNKRFFSQNKGNGYIAFWNQTLHI